MIIIWGSIIYNFNIGCPDLVAKIIKLFRRQPDQQDGSESGNIHKDHG
jgi:hypothetical protein